MAERLSDVVSISLDAINRLQTNENDAVGLYQNTVRRFGRNRNVSGERGSSTKRGRKAHHLNCHMFLLAKRADFLPPLSEQNRLTRNGLGSPKHELPGLTETALNVTKYPLNRRLSDFEDFIISSYPDAPLTRTGFDLGRVNEGKRLELLIPLSLEDLRTKLKKGRLIIIPKREILLPLTNTQTSNQMAGASNQNQNTVPPSNQTHTQNSNQMAGQSNQNHNAGPSNLMDVNSYQPAILSIPNLLNETNTQDSNQIAVTLSRNCNAGPSYQMCVPMGVHSNQAAVHNNPDGPGVQDESNTLNFNQMAAQRNQNHTAGPSNQAAVHNNPSGPDLQDETNTQDSNQIAVTLSQNRNAGPSYQMGVPMGVHSNQAAVHNNPDGPGVQDESNTLNFNQMAAQRNQNHTAGPSNQAAVHNNPSGPDLQDENTNNAMATGWPSESPSSSSDESADLPPAPEIQNIRARTPRIARRAALQCRHNIQTYAATIQRRHVSASAATASRVPVTHRSISDINGENTDSQIHDVMEIIDSEENTDSQLHDVLEIIDSEDEELQRAVDASLQTAIHDGAQQSSIVVNIKDLIGDLQAAVNTSVQQEIVISRKAILNSAFRAIRRPFFDVNCRLYVKFSGEMGEDHGGPRREFFRLALQELNNSSLFEGQDGFKVFSHDVAKLEDQQYKLAGTLVAMSVLHDGPGMNFINPVLYDLMTGVEVSLESFNLDQITDEECRIALLQLKEADTAAKMDSALSSHGDMLIKQGIPVIWRLKVHDRFKAIAQLVKQHIFYRTNAEIAEFKNGINKVCNLWDRISQHPKQWKEILFHKSSPLNKTSFMDLFQVEWSIEGSNNKQLEDDTVYCWEVFLQEVQEGTTPLTFEDILSFVTGADAVPLFGFHSKIMIQFYTPESGSRRLPSVSTCALIMSLPRGINEPEDFQSMMIQAIKDSAGFGKI